MRLTTLILRAGTLALAGTLAGCASSGGDNTLTSFLYYGGPTVPTEAPPSIDEIDCPRVDIVEGGAAIRVGGGDQVRQQVSITNVARECTPTGGGAYTLKIGVEGLALLGPSGGSGRITAPLRIVVKRGSTIIANRARQIAVSIPPGQANTTFSAVEDGILVPAGGEAEIQVGLGGNAQAGETRRRRARH